MCTLNDSIRLATSDPAAERFPGSPCRRDTSDGSRWNSRGCRGLASIQCRRWWTRLCPRPRRRSSGAGSLWSSRSRHGTLDRSWVMRYSPRAATWCCVISVFPSPLPPHTKEEVCWEPGRRNSSYLFISLCTLLQDFTGTLCIHLFQVLASLNVSSWNNKFSGFARLSSW